MTLDYCRERTAFGRPIGQFQANGFTLAELATEADVARVFVDRCIEAHLAGELTAVDAAKAKWWTTELQKRVVDSCLQLFGGYGYMTRVPDQPRLPRHPRADHLRRHHRGDEGDHRPRPAIVLKRLDGTATGLRVAAVGVDHREDLALDVLARDQDDALLREPGEP